MRNKLLFLGIMISFSGYTQSVKDLEFQLSCTPILDIDSIRLIANQIFKTDKYNETAVYFLLESYRFQSDDSPEILFFTDRSTADIDTTISYNDSIDIFFQNLINSDKSNPEPYILKAKFLYERFTDSSRIKYLEFALELDSNNISANYMLAQSYYYLFNELMNRDEKNPQIQTVASKSAKRLEKVMELDSTKRVALKFPLIQLANFLNDSAMIDRYKSEKIPQSLYLPILTYSKIPKNWEFEFKTNVFFAAEIAIMQIDGISRLLDVMSEKSILTTSDSIQVFRFIWIRSFHSEISVRLEKVSQNVTIYWKECNDPYVPTGLKVDRNKTLTMNEWNEFIKKTEKAKFWYMDTFDDEFDGCDGASWILEGFNKKYHVVDRWSPRSTDFKECCTYLLSLTDLMTNELRIY
jgi:hypothetical protein